MKIGMEDVEYVARLARLMLSDEEKDEFVVQLDDILTYMDKLNELNTEKVEPTSHVIPVKNVFRNDEIREPLSREPSLENAPETEKGFYKVPKIIE
ncbi:MAG: Asp-tRNA(Asn)/Glu-tRNA(Gln) amidotransferase subunit GatC [Proteobacteria bacterium]|nr:Asp-tRNA(Asn)/Glu-tRNA(Gln) amidotransferase subunit GatC [Pseudomonadota bacterium]